MNSLGETHKNITIKKILQEMEKDLKEAEEENYQLVKEQAEQRMIKANPKLAAQRMKMMEGEKSPQTNKSLTKSPSVMLL